MGPNFVWCWAPRKSKKDIKQTLKYLSCSLLEFYLKILILVCFRKFPAWTPEDFEKRINGYGVLAFSDQRLIAIKFNTVQTIYSEKQEKLKCSLRHFVYKLWYLSGCCHFATGLCAWKFLSKSQRTIRLLKEIDGKIMHLNNLPDY